MPPAGCQVQGRRAMGGDLMAREWDVPGYTGVKVLGSGGFGEVVNMENAFLKKKRVRISRVKISEVLLHPQYGDGE